MSERDDGGAVFPSEQRSIPYGTWNQTFEIGMSLRDYFAAKALSDAIAEYRTNREIDDGKGCVSLTDTVDAESIAYKAYFIADAMIKERAK